MVHRLKAVWEGSLFGVERFCFGMHYVSNTSEGASAADIQDWAEAIAGVTQTHESDGWCAEFSTAGAIDTVKTYLYPDSGPSLYTGTAPVTSVSGAGTANRPAQISRVVTLLTGINGRRFRGRFYLPSLTGTIDSFGRDVVDQAWADAMVDFMRDVGVAWPNGVAPVAPVVYSAASDTVTAVTSIRVGSVLDTQRNRAKNLPETYFSATV